MFSKILKAYIIVINIILSILAVTLFIAILHYRYNKSTI